MGVMEILDGKRKEIEKLLKAGESYSSIIRKLNLGVHRNTFLRWRKERGLVAPSVADKYEIEPRASIREKLGRPLVVSMVSYKGGVGKSTVCNLLDFKNSKIINFDREDVAHVNAGERTVDYYARLEEIGEEIPPLEFTEELMESERDTEILFLDTPGEATGDFVELRRITDVFIIVAQPTVRAVGRTLSTAVDVSAWEGDYLAHAVYNMADFKIPGMKETIELYSRAFRETFAERFSGESILPFSSVVHAVDRTGKTLKELVRENDMIYGRFAAKVAKMKSELAATFEKAVEIAVKEG